MSPHPKTHKSWGCLGAPNSSEPTPNPTTFSSDVAIVVEFYTSDASDVATVVEILIILAIITSSIVVVASIHLLLCSLFRCCHHHHHHLRLPSSPSSTSSSVPSVVAATITIFTSTIVAIAFIHFLLHSLSLCCHHHHHHLCSPTSSFAPSPPSTLSLSIQESKSVINNQDPKSVIEGVVYLFASSLPAATPSIHLPPLPLPLLLCRICNPRASSSISVTSVDEPPPPPKKTPPHVMRSYSIGSSQIHRGGGDQGGDGRRLRTRSGRVVACEPPSSFTVVGTAI